MSDSPLFSVLIANYNNGDFLMDAIKSVREQTYSHWEIILVDDASTDRSLELYQQLKEDDRIHIFFNEKNSGCGYTKRRCVELSNGEICGFLDPDDTLEADALELMVGEHVKRNDVSLVYSKHYFSDVNLNTLGISTSQCVIPEGKSFLEYGKGAVSAFATFKKDSYNRSCGLNPSYKRAIDHDLYFILEEVGKLSFIDKPLYHYRFETGKNISTCSNSNAAFLWDIVIMADACRRRNIDLEKVLAGNCDHYFENMKEEARLQGMDNIRQTTTYRIGKTILYPLKVLKGIFKR